MHRFLSWRKLRRFIWISVNNCSSTHLQSSCRWKHFRLNYWSRKKFHWSAMLFFVSRRCSILLSMPTRAICCEFVYFSSLCIDLVLRHSRLVNLGTVGSLRHFGIFVRYGSFSFHFRHSDGSRWTSDPSQDDKDGSAGIDHSSRSFLVHSTDVSLQCHADAR